MAQSNEPIPSHVKLAVLGAMQANDFDGLDSMAPDDRAAAQRYITSLAAYATMYPDAGMKRRSAAEIEAAEQEYFDRLWYYRTMSSVRLRALPEAQDSIKRIEVTYHDLQADQSRVEEIEGKLSALRWVLGDEWDNLDT